MKRIEAAQIVTSYFAAKGEEPTVLLSHSRQSIWNVKGTETGTLRRVVFAEVDGNLTITEVQEWPEAKEYSSCGAKCINAKSVDCTCTCAGKNHGTGLHAEAPRPELPALGTVKFGRNVLPARKFSDGRIERNTKTDGTGSWVPATAGSMSF